MLPAIAIISLLTGIILKLWIRRRIFYRRSATGLQQFSNFRNALIIPVLERLASLIAGILILAGVFFACLSIMN